MPHPHPLSSPLNPFQELRRWFPKFLLEPIMEFPTFNRLEFWPKKLRERTFNLLQGKCCLKTSQLSSTLSRFWSLPPSASSFSPPTKPTPLSPTSTTLSPSPPPSSSPSRLPTAPTPPTAPPSAASRPSPPPPPPSSPSTSLRLPGSSTSLQPSLPSTTSATVSCTPGSPSLSLPQTSSEPTCFRSPSTVNYGNPIHVR